MGEQMIEVADLKKTFRGFDNVPKGDEKTAYVFFQSKDNSKYVISTEKRKIMSAQLRMGKYDQIMTIHLGEFMKVLQKQIACEEMGHSFFADVEVKYFITDPEAVYLNRNYDVSEQIERNLSDLEFALGQKYGFRDQAAFKKDLYELVMEKMRKLSFLEYSIQLKLDIDEDAKAIITREHSHEYKNIDNDLEVIEKQNKLMNESELTQMRLEEEKKKALLEAQLQTMKMEQLGDLIKKFGINAGNMIDHVDGKMSGAQLSEVIAKTLRGNREEEYNRIIKLYKEGIIGSDIAEQWATLLIGTEEGKNISGLLTAKEEEKKAEQPENRTFQFNETDGEDDTI